MVTCWPDVEPQWEAGAIWKLELMFEAAAKRAWETRLGPAALGWLNSGAMWLGDRALLHFGSVP